MSTPPRDPHLAPQPASRPKRVGISIWKEARLREQLRTATPSEPWVDEQFKSALAISPNGCAFVYRYHDPEAFPPGGPEHTAMVKCPTCNIFNPPQAFENGQCLDHADQLNHWGPSPSAIAIERLRLLKRRLEQPELPPEDFTSLRREIQLFRRAQNKNQKRAREQ